MRDADLVGVDRADLQAEPGRVVEEGLVLDHRRERRLQDLGTIGGNAGRRGNRQRHQERQLGELDQRPVGVGLGQLASRRECP